VGIAAVILAVGLAGFWFKYQDYFEKGATSTSARLDYWRAAWQTFLANPVLGTGPGTFMVSYKQIKAPESEMARLAHNDFLQQASDSGLPGFLAYAGFVWLSLVLLWRRRSLASSFMFRGIWLGLAGLAAQSLVEFGLYVPALAWPFFLLLGWLWNTVPAPPAHERHGQQVTTND
jgi:putative inorganic carbon (HCO3(-)) transporter